MAKKKAVKKTAKKKTNKKKGVIKTLVDDVAGVVDVVKKTVTARRRNSAYDLECLENSTSVEVRGPTGLGRTMTSGCHNGVTRGLSNWRSNQLQILTPR